MSTETNTPDVTELTTEVERLRKTNKELLEAKHSLKSKVAELEASAVTLQQKIDSETAARYESAINVPLKRMAAKMAILPEIFLQEFEKDFKLDIDEKTGALILLTKDSEPVKNKDGKPLEATEQNLYQYLGLEITDLERRKTFAYLLKYAGAAGGGAGSLDRAQGMFRPQPESKPAPVINIPQFGLK